MQPSITPPISVGTSFTQNVSDKYTTSSEFVSSEKLTQDTSVPSALSTLESGGFTSESVMTTLIDNAVTTKHDSKYGRTSASSVTSAAVITPSTSTFVPSISDRKVY